MDETWLPVVGHEGSYEVSDLGRVRSLDRTLTYVASGQTRSRWITGQVLTPQVHGKGYVFVTLPPQKPRNVHRLVAAAFLGPCPPGMNVCHNNGNPADNRPENLRYDTPSGNMQDRIRHGNNPQLNKTHCPQGHEYTPENTGRNGSGRRCLTCHCTRQKARQARQRQEAMA